MNATRMRRYNAIARSTILAAAAGLAALSLAGPGWADAHGTILNTSTGGACPQYCGGPEGFVGLGVTNAQPNVEVTFTNDPGSQCPNFTVQANFDGATPVTFGTVMPLAPGTHSLNLFGGNCPGGGAMSVWKGTVKVSDVHVTGVPVDANAQPAATAPKDAIVVDVEQSPTNVSVNVKNTSTLSGKCTYNARPTNNPLLPPVHRDFNLNPNDTTKLDFLAPPPLATYHLVVSCHGTFNGKDDEFGHFEQDVTGGL